MIFENDLLYALSDREAYYKYKKYIKKQVLTFESETIIKDMDLWFKANTTEARINWSSFGAWFKLVRHSEYDAEKLKLYHSIFSKLAAMPTSTTTVEAIVTRFIDLEYATKLGHLVQDVLENKGGTKLADAVSIVEDYVRKGHIDEEVLFVEMDANKLADELLRSDGYEWDLEDLNVSIGPVHQGDFIIIGGRPEVGKTSLALHELMYMGQQLAEDKDIYIFNNEEGGSKIGLRCFQIVTSMESRTIEGDPATANSLFLKKMKRADRVKIYDRAVMTKQEIERVLQKGNPGLILFNTLPKVKGFSTDNKTEALAESFQWGRELSKTYCPTFTTMQADSTAEGQQWVYKNQLHYSKTDVQGEADVIITIGSVHDITKAKIRYIHVPKNKLPGGPRSDPTHSHGFFEVHFEPTLGQYKSTMFKR